VFVDATGRRRLWATWGAGATSALCCVYVFVLGVGLAGGAVRPGELLPGASRRNEARNEARYEPAARVARAPAAVPTTTTDTAPPATARTSAQRAATTPTEAPPGQRQRVVTIVVIVVVTVVVAGGCAGPDARGHLGAATGGRCLLHRSGITDAQPDREPHL
jgi:hypothetical protein